LPLTPAAPLRDRRKTALATRILWAVRVGEDDGELRPWYYIYVNSIEKPIHLVSSAC